MTVLAVGGYAESGKDAFVDALEVMFDYKRTFMSKPLMNALLTLDPMVQLTRYGEPVGKFVRYSALHEIVGYSASKREPEVRRLLQILGTEIGRTLFGEDAWINLILEELDTDLISSWAITGIRYPNELELLKRRGTVSVWINRPGVAPVNSHSSDNTLGPEDFDYQIDNDGSLEDLAAQALLLHKQLQENPVESDSYDYTTSSSADPGAYHDLTVPMPTPGPTD